MSRLTRSFFNPLELKQTWLHRLNPALKVGASIFLLVMIFLPTSILMQVILLVTIICMLASAHVSKGSILAILKTCLILFVIVFLISWLIAKDPRVIIDLNNSRRLWGYDWETLHRWGWVNKQNILGLDIYWYTGQIWGGWVGDQLWTSPPTGQYFQFILNGTTVYLPYYAPVYALSSHTLISTIFTFVKIFMMLSIFSIQVNTTTTLGLGYGIETILTPLKFIKVPTAQIGMVIAIAIKFIPNLLAEANAVSKAQASRGLDLHNGRIFNKIKALTSLIVPMFAITFNQADQLADAMEARNYNPRIKRTRYRRYLVKWYDWTGFTIIVLLFILLVIMVAWKVIIGPFALMDLHLV